jgi:hypothetical protein
LDIWRLDSFDIPKPDSKSPIIFIDPEIDADLRSSPRFKRYPFNDFGFSFTTIPYLKTIS